MALTSGTRVGPYEIVSALGSGGMGEVYKARDTRLDRPVAIKVLPSEVASDPDLRARFEREARAVAALDHPHICGIYDVGESHGTHYLVMPHLEGQTLAARLEKGPLPLDQALKIATEIADALDKAHRQGIIHRDLKPANIMLTKAGSKLLDFGLAKLRGTTGPISMSDMSRLATRAPETAHGMILGTVQYMAPEQVEGKDADARSDIWALGAVIYEMVTGTRPFQGDTPASVIGAILKDEPPPVSSRQPLSPPMLDRVVAGCFEKDPDARWRSAGDLLLMLKWVGDGRVVSTAALPRRSSGLRVWLPLAAAGVLLIGVLTLLPGWWAHRGETPPAVIQLSVLPPPGTTLSSPPASIVAPQLAISPDGQRVAFVAEAPRGRPSLWVRTLGDSEAQLLRGTEDAIYPFWKPDSRSLGFFAQGKLKTIEIGGGQPRTLSDAPLDSRGGTWGPDDTILFAPNAMSGIFRIAAKEGTASQVTKFDASRAENSHRFPSFLPDGKHFLYTTRSERQEHWGVSIASLDSPVGTPLIDRTEWSAQFAPPGYILFVRAGTLMAQPFDLDRMSTTAEAVEIASDIGVTATGYAAFSASHTVIVHARHIGLPGELRWFDRSGNHTGSVGTTAEYLDFELSPDERTVAVSPVDPKLKSADVWLLDLARNVPTKFTRDPQNDASALWSPDGGSIVFRSNRHGYSELYRRRSSGTEAELAILSKEANVVGSDWSLDGKSIVYTKTSSSSGFDIWVLPTDGDMKPRLVVRSALNAMHGRLSPNGRWLAYASDESGELQVYVQPFPTTGDKRTISPDGGSEPRWRRDGNELFYLAPSNKLMSVPIPGGSAFDFGTPRALFDVHVPLTGNPYRSNYTVTANGQRFLINTRIEDTPSPINIILNWTSLLNK